MLSKLSKLLIIFVLLFYLFKWLFLWLFETSDSYFYWAFADFLWTGKYFAPHPYYWTTPTTFAAPLYSLFLFFIRWLFPQSTQVYIHLTQSLAIIISAFLLAKILSSFLKREIALIITSIYLLLPANIFISVGLMPEPLAILTVSIYIFFFFQLIVKKKLYLFKYLLLFSAIMVLLRYNFLILFLLAVVLWILTAFRKIRFYDSIFLILSISIIISWVFVNHKLTGAWGLSDQVGKNLYNRVVGGDKLIPPIDDPNWQLLNKINTMKLDLFQPSYTFDPYIMDYFNGNVTAESKFLGQIALATIKKHPIAFLKNTLLNFLIIHGNGMPYSTDLYTHAWLKQTCRKLDTISFCKPIIESQFAAPLWDFMVQWGEYYYYTIPVFFNFLLLSPALMFGFFQKNIFIKFTAIVYILSILTVVAAEVPVYRYAYPLLPVKFILVSFFLTNLFQVVKNFSRNFFR